VLVLGIDTSDGVSVAVRRGEEVVARADGPDPRRHAETLAPAVAWALAEAGVRARDLDLVAVGTGPAPFTGLRVGLVTARTLARALGVRLVGVCSLDALARQAFDDLGDAAPAEVLAVADARRSEVYSARYRRAAAAPDDDVERLAGPSVSAAATLRGALDAAAQVPAGVGVAEAIRDGRLAVVGRGARLYADQLPPTPGGPLAVDAAVLARVARHRASRGGETGLEPRYLRRPDVTPPAARKRAS
jgi:tRNA threonylcarbamoyladenosine biosynthesis protein TsaB